MNAHHFPSHRPLHRGIMHRRSATDYLLPVAVAFLAFGALLVGWTLGRW